MSRKRRLSVDEKREVVLEYLSVPYGERGEWLDSKGLTPSAVRDWRAMMAAGTLETGLIPRGGKSLPVEENVAISRLHQENKRLRAELDKARADIDRQVGVSEALGKAIELLRDAREKDRTPEPEGQGGGDG